MTKPTPYPQRLAQCLRQATSSFDGEAIAGLRAFRRTLKAHGEDLHSFADRIEQANGVSEEDMARVYAEGVKAGHHQAENERHRGKTFHDIDEVKDLWGEVANFCQARTHRLPEPERKFVEGMTGLVLEKALSPRQASWLISIYRKLGGVLPKA